MFAFYLAAVPAYGAQPALLFGFLFLIDAGLLAIALVRRQGALHAVGAAATLLVTATWLASSYPRSGDGLVAVGFASLFVAVLSRGAARRRRLARPLTGAAVEAHYAGPLLLFAFPVLAAIEPAFVAARGR